MGLTNLKEMGENYLIGGKFFLNDNLKKKLGAFFFNWGHFFKLGENVLLEFEKKNLLGAFFSNWGQMC